MRRKISLLGGSSVRLFQWEESALSDFGYEKINDHNTDFDQKTNEGSAEVTVYPAAGLTKNS